MNKGKDAFDIEVLIKHKYLRSNQILFMNKELLKAIKNRTKLRNRTRCIGDKEAYNKQQDYCVSLIWKTKQQYFNNLDHRNVADKSSNCNKITRWKKI